MPDCVQMVLSKSQIHIKFAYEYYPVLSQEIKIKDTIDDIMCSNVCKLIEFYSSNLSSN